jgi:hypothetical protein
MPSHPKSFRFSFVFSFFLQAKNVVPQTATILPDPAIPPAAERDG